MGHRQLRTARAARLIQYRIIHTEGAHMQRNLDDPVRAAFTLGLVAGLLLGFVVGVSI